MFCRGWVGGRRATWRAFVTGCQAKWYIHVESLKRAIMRHTGVAFRHVIAALAVSVFCACGSSTEPYAEHAVEVSAPAVPMKVAPTDGFDVDGTYFRGACVTSRRVIVRNALRVRIAIRSKQAPLPSGVFCADHLYNETVSVRIDPPYTLPFTVRFDRGDRADTVRIVRPTS